jgi:transcriptional regulator with XRE-family HTH domain
MCPIFTYLAYVQVSLGTSRSCRLYLTPMSGASEPVDNSKADAVDNFREERQVRFGESVQRLRLARNQSIKAAAGQAKVSHVTWTRVENGHGVYNRTLVRLDEYLGISRGTTSHALEHPDAFEGLLRQIEEATKSIESNAQQRVLDDHHGPKNNVNPSGHNDSQISSSRGFQSLLSRIEGLDFEELKRLRDMINAAILVHNKPRIEVDKARAAEAVAHASAARTQAEYEFETHQERQQQGEDIDHEELQQLKHRVRELDRDLAVAQARFKYLDSAIRRGQGDDYDRIEDMVRSNGER